MKMNAYRKIIIVLLSVITLFVGMLSVYIYDLSTQYVLQTFDVSGIIVRTLFKILFFVFLLSDGFVIMRYTMKFLGERKSMEFLLITKSLSLVCGFILTLIISIIDFHLRIELFRTMIPFALVNILTIGWLIRLKKL